MLRSTFAGFTTAQLALAASQRALDVTGQNISNINTPGYTRQRLDLASISVSGASHAMMQVDNRVGQGVQMTGVTQIRDPFLDIQYRNHLAKVGTIDAQNNMLEGIGEIFDEVDSTAIRAALNDVVKQLQNMAGVGNSGESSSDALVRSSLEVLLNLVHENGKALDRVESELIGKLESTDVPNINQYLDSIQKLNESIKNTQILGNPALELLDQRNALIDDLATYLPIKVSYNTLNLGSGIQVDTLKIDFLDTNGTRHTLIDDAKKGEIYFESTESEDGTATAPVKILIRDADTFMSAKDAFPKMQAGDTKELNQLMEQIAKTADALKATPNDPDLTTALTNDVKALEDKLTALGDNITFNDNLNGAGDGKGTISITTADGREIILIGDDSMAGDRKGFAAFQFNDDTGPAVSRAGRLEDVTNVLGDGVLKGDMDALNKSGIFDDPASDFKGIGYYEKYFNAFIATFAETLNNANIPVKVDANGDPVLDANGDPVLEAAGTNPLLEKIDPTKDWSATNVKIADAWKNNEYGVTLSTEVLNGKLDTTGNKNVLSMIEKLTTAKVEIKTERAGIIAFTGNLLDAYDHIQNTQAVEQKATESILESRYKVMNQIADSKDAISGVYMDEEVMGLMRYQQSYNAAARLMTTLDEMLGTLINNTGVVGR